MISLIVLIFTILIACVLAKYASRLKGQNIYSYIADKHEVHYKESSHALLEDGPVISSGYFVVTSYPDTSVCNGDAYAIAFVKLGSCGVYHANYSDPNAVPQSCGSYVTPTVHRSSNDGQSIYVLSYTFYTDAACTNVGTGPECVQNLPIYASCTADTYKNTSSSSNTSFVETLQIPTGGILSRYL